MFKFIKCLFKKEEYKDDRINCEKHGHNKPSLMLYSNGRLFKKVCYECWGEKTTEGLDIYE